jgi:hypothetical protein
MRGKKERFSGAAAEAKGNKRKKELEEKGRIFLVFEGSSRKRGKKENSTSGWVFHGFSWCSCSWTPQLVIGSILFRILSILFKLGFYFY